MLAASTEPRASDISVCNSWPLLAVHDDGIWHEKCLCNLLTPDAFSAKGVPHCIFGWWWLCSLIPGKIMCSLPQRCSVHLLKRHLCLTLPSESLVKPLGKPHTWENKLVMVRSIQQMQMSQLYYLIQPPPRWTWRLFLGHYWLSSLFKQNLSVVVHCLLNCAVLAALLCEMNCVNNFDAAKSLLCNVPVLAAPNFSPL